MTLTEIYILEKNCLGMVRQGTNLEQSKFKLEAILFQNKELVNLECLCMISGLGLAINSHMLPGFYNYNILCDAAFVFH